MSILEYISSLRYLPKKKADLILDILNCYDKPQKAIIIAINHKVTDRFIYKLMNELPPLVFGNQKVVYKRSNGVILTEILDKNIVEKGQTDIIELFPVSEKNPKPPPLKKLTKQEKYAVEIEEVFDYLNMATLKNFRKAKADVTLLIALLEDKRTVDEIKYVIDIKTAQWLDTENDKYLRPSTLFRQSNFDSYVNEKPIIQKKSIGQKNYEALERYKQSKAFSQNR